MMDKVEGNFILFGGKNVHINETILLKLDRDSDNAHAIYLTRQIAVKIGFQRTDEVMIATAASELSTNIIRYAKQGEIFINTINSIEEGKIGIELFAVDKGPGIQDIELAMTEQYSSLPNSLGLGLPSVKRIMDEFYIESIVGRGTRILARKWKR